MEKNTIAVTTNMLENPRI